MKSDVLVVDDHAIVRDGLRRLLGETADLEVAGDADNGNTALEQVRQRSWGLVVLDLSLPGRNGLELIRLLHAVRSKLPILIFSMHQEEHYAVRAIRAGASGYLTKDCPVDQIVPAMRKVANGGMFVSPRVAELLAFDVAHPHKEDDLPHKRLTDREYEIFSRIVQGISPTEIATELSLSVKTISSHKTHILEKMGLANQVELVRYALRQGLLDPIPQ